MNLAALSSVKAVTWSRRILHTYQPAGCCLHHCFRPDVAIASPRGNRGNSVKVKIAIAVCLASAAAPAWADKMFAVTPSGAAEMLFAQGPQAVVSTISGKCIDTHWTLISSSASEVVCEAPMTMGQSVLGQVLMGNSYSTPPRRFFRFNIAEVNGVARVQASGWMELQMAFGQMRRTDFTGPEFYNGIFNFMAAAGGQFPVGTTFPNHVVLGFKPTEVALGSYRGMRIDEFAPGSAAARAGLQVGDVVTSVAGKKFKNRDDYLDATAQAAEKPAYAVEYMRNGKKLTVSVQREFRPPITQSVLAQAAPAAPATVGAQPASVADELTKLVKLRDTGVLTRDEFDAQKKKLLAQ